MQHVVGADFAYIMHCNHNRRSFVFCCLDMFQQLGLDDEITLPDLHNLYCLVCPALNLAVLQEAALYVGHSKASHVHFHFGELQMSFFFQILFYEWLTAVAPIFQEGESRKAILVRADDAVLAIEECTRISTSMQFHLPVSGISDTLRSLAQTHGAGADIGLKDVIKALLFSPSIKVFLLSKRR